MEQGGKSVGRIVVKGSVAAAAGLLLVGLASSSVSGQEGKELYERTCAACHGTSGKGDGPAGQYLQPKPAEFGVVLQGKDDAYIAKVITEGGAAVGKSPIMAAYKGMLRDEQIQALVQYLKTFVAQ